jgi:hypothetical protein
MVELERNLKNRAADCGSANEDGFGEMKVESDGIADAAIRELESVNRRAVESMDSWKATSGERATAVATSVGNGRPFTMKVNDSSVAVVSEWMASETKPRVACTGLDRVIERMVRSRALFCEKVARAAGERFSWINKLITEERHFTQRTSRFSGVEPVSLHDITEKYHGTVAIARELQSDSTLPQRAYIISLDPDKGTQIRKGQNPIKVS